MRQKLNIIVFILFMICQTITGQSIKKDCPKEISFFAYSIDDWYVPIKYNIVDNLIDLIIMRKDKEELFIRFKIIKKMNCDFIDASNCKLKYKILTYDEETNSYEKRESEIEFFFENGKGKIFIRHPNFPVIESDATSNFTNE